MVRVSSALIAGLLSVALILLATGCGSSETKTVTETVTTEASEAPGSESESTPEGAGSAGPTSTTIPEGTWAPGEIAAGTYRAKGGELCEYATGPSAKSVQNGEGHTQYGTNVLVELSGNDYFRTEECGTFELVK